jgi:hypothetical protein
MMYHDATSANMFPLPWGLGRALAWLGITPGRLETWQLLTEAGLSADLLASLDDIRHGQLVPATCRVFQDVD